MAQKASSPMNVPRVLRITSSTSVARKEKSWLASIRQEEKQPNITTSGPGMRHTIGSKNPMGKNINTLPQLFKSEKKSVRFIPSKGTKFIFGCNSPRNNVPSVGMVR